jgi:hypothetical protein
VRADFPPFSGPFNLLGNRRIGLLLSYNGGPLFLPMTLSETRWRCTQGPLTKKVMEALRRG